MAKYQDLELLVASAEQPWSSRPVSACILSSYASALKALGVGLPTFLSTDAAMQEVLGTQIASLVVDVNRAFAGGMCSPYPVDDLPRLLANHVMCLEGAILLASLVGQEGVDVDGIDVGYRAVSTVHELAGNEHRARDWHQPGMMKGHRIMSALHQGLVGIEGAQRDLLTTYLAALDHQAILRLPLSDMEARQRLTKALGIYIAYIEENARPV